ncbi:MAG: hypothetical protein JJU40_03985 [Rhodobacteraceae bacterium]|nr:hypothetical protein [Paracoccaceae bacterium]
MSRVRPVFATLLRGEGHISGRSEGGVWQGLAARIVCGPEQDGPVMSDVFLSRPSSARVPGVLRRLLERVGLRFPITIPSPFYLGRSGEWAPPKPAAQMRPVEEGRAFRTDLEALAGTLAPIAEGSTPREGRARAELSDEQKRLLRGKAARRGRGKGGLARVLAAFGIALPIRIASPIYIGSWRCSPADRPRTEPRMSQSFQEDLRRLRG